MQPEKRLQELVMLSIGICFPKRSYVWKFHATEYDPAGIPDLIGHIDGHFVALELKVEGNYFSDVQKVKLARFEATGCRGAAGIYQLRDGTVWFIPPSEVSKFSLRDRSGWLPLIGKLWTDSAGKVHAYLDLTPLRVQLLE